MACNRGPNAAAGAGDDSDLAFEGCCGVHRRGCSILFAARRRKGQTSMASIVCILILTGSANGNSLAFDGRGTYNPASREKGSAVTTLHRGSALPALPGSPAFQSRIRNKCGPDGMQLLRRVQRTRFPK